MTALCIFLLFVLIGSVASEQNYLVINEINTDDIGGKEFDEFIELKAVHAPGATRPSLREYIVIAVKAATRRSASPVIIFSADLYHKSFSGNSANRFFVIGSSSRTLNPDMKFLDGDVYYENREAAVASTQTLTALWTKQTAPDAVRNVLADGEQYPMALILLKDEDRSTKENPEIDKVRLKSRNAVTHRTEQQPFKKVTSELETIIKRYIVDMVVYSKRSQFSRCAIFENICAALAERIAARAPAEYCYELMPAREWDKEGHEDVSVNRCPRSESEKRQPFLFHSWKLGKKSPAAENNCDGPHFIIEDTFGRVDAAGSSAATSNSGRISADRPCSGSFTAALGRLDFNAAVARRDEAIASAATAANSSFDTEGMCPISEDFPDDATEGLVFRTAEGEASARIDLRLDELTAMVKHMKEMLEKQQKESPLKKKTKASETVETQTSEPNKQWLNVHNFNPLWERLISKHHSNHAKMLLNRERKPWLVYLPNEQESSASRLNCRFCVDYVRRHPSEMINPNPQELATDNGIAIDSNTRTYLSRHAATSLHQKAENELKMAHEQTLMHWINEYRTAAQERTSQEHQATDRMIRTVYTEVRLNIPFLSHREIVWLQKENGAELGTHHFERTSATKMAEVIADTMHDTLVAYINSNTYPLSIIMDTATDPSQKNYLIIYLRTLENDFPRTYFYSLLLVESESAASLLDLINAKLRQDGLYDLFNKRLIGYASDGAAVMRSEGNGLAGRIQSQAENHIYIIHCMAHRLQLAIGHAMENTFLDTHFEKTINGIYSFYNNKAVKRKATLRNTAEALDQTFYELNYIFEVRWVASELKALERLMLNYRTILENLAHIEASPATDFDSDTKATAKGYYTILMNSRFLVTLAFMRDVLTVFKARSEDVQKASSVLIGQESVRQKLIRSLQALQTGNGANIQHILDKAKCSSDGAVWTKCSIRHLDNHQIMYPLGDINYTFLPPTGRQTAYPPLSEFREEFLANVIEQLDKYFPEGKREWLAHT